LNSDLAEHGTAKGLKGVLPLLAVLFVTPSVLMRFDVAINASVERHGLGLLKRLGGSHSALLPKRVLALIEQLPQFRRRLPGFSQGDGVGCP
jgi:hypothetical protein